MASLRSTRLRALGAAVVLAGLAAGCENGPSVVTRYVAPNGTQYVIDELLAKRSPILMEVKGTLFGARAANLDALLHEQIPVLVRGQNVSATDDPAASAMPEVRIVIAFGLPVNYDSRKLCVEAEPPVEERTDDRIAAASAFCVRGEVLAHADGWVRASDPNDRGFQTFLFSLTRAVIVDRQR